MFFYLETRSKVGEDNKVENMPMDADNHVGVIYKYKIIFYTIERGLKKKK